MSFIFGRNRGFRRSDELVRQIISNGSQSVRRGKSECSPYRSQHLRATMPSEDALFSLQGVRFRETIVTSTNTSTTGHKWLSPSVTPDPVIQGPLITFSFLLPEKEEKVSYQRQQQLLKEAFENCPLFKDGLLLDTREKGVLFPVVHLSYKGELGTTAEDVIPGGFILHQGIYQEVRNIVPETELPQVAPYPQEQRNIGYILLGFKSLDRNFSQVMVDTWKDWTGARYIYMYLPDDLGLRRITFYHRQQPDDLDFFMYLVVVECHGITSREKQIRLLDFAQRMRLERMTGYISVYSGERKGICEPFRTEVATPSKTELFDTFLTNTLIPKNTRV